MEITGIEKAKGSRYTVYVDGEYWYILDQEILLQNGLSTGMQVDPDRLEDLRCQAERRTARERAYYLLGYRDHSKKELYEKLLKSARPEIAREIVALVEEQGYLNDERYAEKLAQYYLSVKKWGEKRARYELLRRGIPVETAEAALAGCEWDPVDQICGLIQKKYARALAEDPIKGKRRVIAALGRAGYSYEDIRQGLNRFFSDSDGFTDEF